MSTTGSSRPNAGMSSGNSHIFRASRASRWRRLWGFAGLRLTEALAKTDWVNSAVFTEQLTAHLWTTHQIDAFRAAAVEYVAKSSAALPDGPLPAHRLAIVVIGHGARNDEYRLFRKLRPQGMYFTQVKQAGGLDTLAAAVANGQGSPVALRSLVHRWRCIQRGSSKQRGPCLLCGAFSGARPVAEPHAEILRSQRVRSGSVSNQAGADTA